MDTPVESRSLMTADGVHGENKGVEARDER